MPATYFSDARALHEVLSAGRARIDDPRVLGGRLGGYHSRSTGGVEAIVPLPGSSCGDRGYGSIVGWRIRTLASDARRAI